MTIRTIALFGMLAGAATSLGAQTKYAPTDTTKTFFRKSDLAAAGLIVGGSAAVSVFDERIAHWWRGPTVQDSARTDWANTLTVVNEVPLTLGAVAAYGVGRIMKNETVADIGLHTTEALVTTVVLAEAIRGPLGRARPRESQDDQYNFSFGRGFHDFAARSYPSIHAAVAFTAASALVGETRLRNPGAVRYVAPVLYTAAFIPGITRMYLNQHWASDVFAGTLMGMLLGSRVVSYAHGHRKSKLDRMLLGATIAPDGHGNTMVGMSFSP